MIDPYSPPIHGRPSIGNLPVGSVSAYAGAIDPGQGTGLEAWGWMLCDGRSLAAAHYPQLFATLGYLYGGREGAFNIPDYRGAFLRGVDHGSGNDPDASSRTAPHGGVAGGVGSTQASTFQDHGQSHDATVGQAARPANIAVNYIIKVSG
ncbi:MAG: phage tail protein [Pseudomonadota bacterium]|jgi:microcystin-dependent protein